MPESDLRYEVKLVVPGHLLPNIKMWVRSHRSAFYEPYPPRQVNSLYLDTKSLDWLYENEEGISSRRKIRIRWYGSDFSKISPVFEIKRKQGRLSWKLRQQLPRLISLSPESSWSDIISDAVASLPISMKSELGADREPILMNQYQRDYYVSRQSGVRLTIDYGYRLFDQHMSDTPNLTRRGPMQPSTVIEVKGSPDAIDEIMDITNQFPVSVSKNSKYALGCESIFAL